MTKKQLRDLIGELWDNMENGTIEKNFFELRQKIYDALYPDV